MSSRTGRVALGLAMTGMGGTSLGLGLFQPAILPGTLLGLPAAAVAVSVGLALLLPGVLLSLFSIRRVPQAASVVPAHVAFVTRTPRPAALPERPVLPARRAPTRKPEEQAAMTRLDDEIRELTRHINRAGVLLATGQLSHQGYASYVADLKKRRGDLEVSRVRIELHRIE
jgi:hypothetical protein